MLDPSARDLFVELARGWLAAGTGHDDVLARLRQRGVDKVDSIQVLATATGVSLSDAKLRVHHSPAWADRRESDERLEKMFWRVLFIECVLSGGRVSEPPEWAVECRERQARAAEQLPDIAMCLPASASDGYHEAMAGNRFGEAFVALVAAGQEHDMSDRYWLALADVAETLCLTELVDGDQDADDDVDELRAARAVLRRTGRIG